MRCQLSFVFLFFGCVVYHVMLNTTGKVCYIVPGYMSYKSYTLHAHVNRNVRDVYLQRKRVTSCARIHTLYVQC